jgi:hypothetical protein
MIAANYRKYADALIRQLELDLSGAQDAATRAAWWTWLMEAGKPQPAQRPEAPAWWVALRGACSRLARAVKAACMGLFNTQE